MGLESDRGLTERDGGFAVAGVAQHDSDVDVDAVWAAFDDFADDLAEVAVGENRYAVLFDLDGRDGEFTYLAGVEIGRPDDLPPEVTVVEVPAASYAVFRPTGETVTDVVHRIEDREFDDDDHLTGPMFERYAPGEDPSSATGSFEFYVPVTED